MIFVTSLTSLSVYKLDRLDLALAAWTLPSAYEDALGRLLVQSNLLPLASMQISRLESRQGLAGEWVAYPSRNASSTSLFFEKSNSAIASYKATNPKRTLFISSDFRAFFAPSQRPEVRFSANFRAFEFPFEAEAIWVWVYLNSRLDSAVAESVNQLNQRWGDASAPNRKHDLYIRPMPDQWIEKIPEALRIIAAVEETSTESMNVSATRATRLSAKETWSLRPKSPSITVGTDEERLSAHIASVFVGKNLGQIDGEYGTPIYDGPWISKGVVSRFADGEFPEATYAEVGDILTPRIGETSRARVVSERGLVVGNFYVLRPNDADLSEEIATFLNSDDATMQRAELCDEGSIFKTISKTDILKLVPKLGLIPVSQQCSKLVNG